MISSVTLKLNMDDYILNALKEDITSEDVSTNAVMRKHMIEKRSSSARKMELYVDWMCLKEFLLFRQ